MAVGLISSLRRPSGRIAEVYGGHRRISAPVLSEPTPGSPSLPPPPGHRWPDSPSSSRVRRASFGLSIILAACLVLAIGAVAAFATAFHFAGIGDAERTAHQPAPLPAALPASPPPLSALADAALASVVTIEVDTARGERFGTGWLLDAGGHIVTNNHVVERQLTLRILDRGGGVHAGLLVAFDPVEDVAVVKLQGHLAAQPLPIGESTPTTGEQVAVLASSRATDHGEASTEVVSRLHDAITINPQPGEPGATDVQYHDMTVLRGAPIYQGNSGGPVIDDRGEVVGIVTATASNPARPEAYAIPIGRVIAELRAFASRS